MKCNSTGLFLEYHNYEVTKYYGTLRTALNGLRTKASEPSWVKFAINKSALKSANFHYYSFKTFPQF